MSRYTTLILLFLLLTAQQFVKAQGYDLNWVFKGKLFDFTQNETKISPFNFGGEKYAYSCISDYNGELALIIKNKIYDSKGNIVYEFERKPEIQLLPIMILPYPNHENRYVCIYLYNYSKLYYLTLEKKDKNITVIELPKLLSTAASYNHFYSIATPSSTSGYWFYIAVTSANELHAFHLSKNGWDKKVISTGTFFAFGESDISRDGRFIFNAGRITEVSPITGRAIRQIQFPAQERVAFFQKCISASGKWIYVTKKTTSLNGSDRYDIVRYRSQYLLTDYNPDLFFASEEYIGHSSISMYYKLAPDNCIYINDKKKLSRIRNPDADLLDLEIEEISSSDTGIFPVVVNARPTLIPQTINCTDVRLRCIGEGIKNYSWNFGDGSPHMQTTIPDVWYRYTKSGTYQVTLTVEWLTGKTYSLQQEVIVPECKPALSFVSDGTCVEQEIRFSTKSTNIKSFIWHFGDGDTSTSINPTHIYKTVGRHIVKLTVTYNDKTTETIEKQITIHAKPKTSAIQF